MSEPHDYVFSEIRFHELPLRKQKNLIKYAKRQVTHYNNVVSGRTGRTIVISPSPKVMLDWWKTVLLLFTLEYEKKRDSVRKSMFAQSGPQLKKTH